MDKKEFYNMVNRVIGDKIFQYEGPVMGGVELNVVMDFKMKLVGDVEVFHMGRPMNHIGIDVSVLKITPPSLDFVIPDIENNRYEIADRIYFLTTKIENYIWSVLQHFSIEDTPVLTSIRFIGKRNHNMVNINETKSDKRSIVRKLVQDIITVFKKGEGEYSLPEDISSNMTYEFPSLSTDFTMEVKIDEDESVEGFELDGGYYDDEDTFEIQIIYNNKFFPDTFYDLIGELNELVRHELQHLIQAEKGTDRPTHETDPEKYYTQPHEVEALISGFRRMAKLRKEPFEKIVRDSFYKNKVLSDEAKERVINVILKAKR